ncbi:MAG: stage II sporulation protein M [Bacilli bacterium]|nr:stage II sporulation protein M [Bacilli bacterium]
MKQIIKQFIIEIKRNKRGYIFILSLILIGIIFGSLFMTILDNHDRLLVSNQVTAFFEGIRKDELTYVVALKNSLISNLLLVLIIWFLGISIIGIPIILFLLFMKGFILGFSIASIIYKFSFKGIFLAFLYIFPQQLITILFLMIVGYYSLNFSYNLFLAIIKRKTINYNKITSKYFRILLMCLILTIVSIIFEIFVAPTLIKYLLKLNVI